MTIFIDYSVANSLEYRKYILFMILHGALTLHILNVTNFGYRVDFVLL